MNKFGWIVKTCAVFLLWAGAAVTVCSQQHAAVPNAPVFTTLHSFCSQGDCADGSDPAAD